MKRPILALVSIVALCACSTTQLSTAEAIAKPIADAALTAAAAHYGVPPTATQAVLTAADSLWGAMAQAQAGQPVAQGASVPSVGAAIAAALPATTSNAQAAALLQSAAQSIPAP